MMNSLFRWFSRNQDAISWFLIGWLSFALLDGLTKGQYGWAAFDAFLIWINYRCISLRF